MVFLSVTFLFVLIYINNSYIYLVISKISKHFADKEKSRYLCY